MSEPATEMFETVDVKKEPKVKPPREMSQAAISAFFYGSLQLLFTSISATVVLVLAEIMKSLQTVMPTSVNGTTTNPANGVSGGTGSLDVAGLIQMVKELGTASGNSVANNPTTIPAVPAVPPTVAVPNTSTIPGMPNLSGLMPQSTPHEIVPLEVLVILLASGFGILGLITAVVAFRATSKGKSGRGLAVTGFMSGLLSLAIAFGVAWIV